MKTKILLTMGLLLPTLAFAIPKLPSEIHQPSHATLLERKIDNDGDFRAQWHVRSGRVDRLLAAAEQTAKKQGYRVVERDLSADEADVSLVYGTRRLNISIDLNSDNTMDYEVELELNH